MSFFSHLNLFFINIKKIVFLLFCYVLIINASTLREDVNALYIPLADHYAAIVAYERYSTQMKYANFKLHRMQNWDLLRAKFQSQDADMAFLMSPLAMDMYHENPHFKWIGLMHRDGNALAVNNLLDLRLSLASDRRLRKPDSSLADFLNKLYAKSGKNTYVGIPHLLSTHAVILYKHLKDNNSTIAFSPNEKSSAIGIVVAPPKSLAYLDVASARDTYAIIEQSLPWAEIAETSGMGKIVWYSKDVIKSDYGHVECIAVATNKSIKSKREAVNEVMHYIRKAGSDIEIARAHGGKKINNIVKIIQKHIPSHTTEAILASLDHETRVINYEKLDVDKDGLSEIMNLAIEGGILKHKIDINSFADTSFSGDNK